MEYAFTDDMIRRDREVLTGQALAYVQHYTGSFGPILQAKAILDEGMMLSVGQIRVILNTMRTDTSVVLNYKPSLAPNVINFPERRPRVDFGYPGDDEEPRETLRQPERRWFRWPFRLKLPHGMSMAVRSEVIHLMSQERSRLEVHPVGSWWNGEKVWKEPIWSFRLYYECSEAAKKLRMLTAYEAEVLVDLGLMRFCRTCQAFRNNRS